MKLDRMAFYEAERVDFVSFLSFAPLGTSALAGTDSAYQYYLMKRKARAGLEGWSQETKAQLLYLNFNKTA